MKNTMIFGIAFLVVLAAVSGQAQAITCGDFAFTNTSDYAGNPIFVHYENPPWTPPTVNLTLSNLGTLTLVSGNNPENGFSGNVYTWELSGGAGSYSLNLTVDEGNTTCTKQLDFTVGGNIDPALDLTPQDLGTEEVNVPFTFDVTLNNTGAGSADNITVYLDLLNSNSDSPKTVASLASSSKTDVQFAVTPTVGCKYYTARVQADYYRSDGFPMDSVFAEDTFYVGGPDLAVTEIKTDGQPVAGVETEVNVTVKNFGSATGRPYTVSLYSGSPGGDLLASQDSGTNLGIGAEETLTLTATFGAGSQTVYAVITSTDECNQNNNQNNAEINGSAVCGDGVCNGGESCGSCPSDCGKCPPGGGGVSISGGVGGGGGGCTPAWDCGDWSECSPDGLQERTCINVGTCGDNTGRPETTQACTYTSPPVPECDAGETRTETCWDGSEIVSETCVDGKWAGTGNTCPAEPGQNPFTGGITGFIIANSGLLAGIIAAIVLAIIGWYFLRPKEDEEEIKYNYSKGKK